LPQNTLAPVNSVINPQLTGPNAGLPGPTPGVRYLIVEDIGTMDDSTTAWGDLIANANDIIEFDADTSQWVVSFDSLEANDVEFVTNLTTGVQYRFVPQEDMWMKSYEGFYGEGDYSIVI
jgi:hypothetical protein